MCFRSTKYVSRHVLSVPEAWAKEQTPPFQPRRTCDLPVFSGQEIPASIATTSIAN